MAFSYGLGETVAKGYASDHFRSFHLMSPASISSHYSNVVLALTWSLHSAPEIAFLCITSSMRPALYSRRQPVTHSSRIGLVLKVCEKADVRDKVWRNNVGRGIE